MVEPTQKKPLPDLPRRVISSSSDKAEFSKRCFLLGDLIKHDDLPSRVLDDILASMWVQSEAVLGIQ